MRSKKRNRSATRLARSPVCADTADQSTSLNLTFKTDRPLVEETVSPSNRTRPVLAGAHTASRRTNGRWTLKVNATGSRFRRGLWWWGYTILYVHCNVYVYFCVCIYFCVCVYVSIQSLPLSMFFVFFLSHIIIFIYTLCIFFVVFNGTAPVSGTVQCKRITTLVDHSVVKVPRNFFDGIFVRGV